MQFEWVKSDLKWRFYELNKSNGKLVICWKCIFELYRQTLRFKKEKAYFQKTYTDRGFYPQKIEGLFIKFPGQKGMG